jgi:hypothetical protein
MPADICILCKTPFLAALNPGFALSTEKSSVGSRIECAEGRISWIADVALESIVELSSEAQVLGDNL